MVASQLCLVRLFAAATMVASLGALATAQSNRPNVLFVMADDLNTALSGLGHPECLTPHLDAFAETGVTFSRAYCQFPLCAPSRASILSGQYPITNGVVGNGGKVDPQRVTLPRHFADHGYWSARVSKIYHMGIPVDIVQGTPGRDHEPSWQETHNIAALETMTPGKVENVTEPEAPRGYPKERANWIYHRQLQTPYKMPGPVRGDYAVVEVEDRNAPQLADWMTADKAIELLRRRHHQSQPFFLAVGFVRPHFPFVSTETTLKPYDAEQLRYPDSPADDLSDIPKSAFGTRKDFDEDTVRRLRRGYYGAIGFMDQQFGRLMKELERLEMRDNTIVVFVSDHGYLLGEHRMWKKACLWEEAIRVPLIISAPGGQRGKRCDHFVELVDLYPTLAELAGLPQDPGTQGQSLTPLLTNPDAKLPKNDALIHVAKGFGLRNGKWAYMWYPKAKKNKQEGVMLYDMSQDPSQHTNLAERPEFATIRQRLHNRLLERIEDAGK